MTTVRLSVDQLIKSQSNVRNKHTKEDIAMMGNSIRNRGIINMPAVAKDGGDKYEIIAGGLRVLGARAAELKEIDCLDVSVLTDAERVDISLAENTDRRRMTAIQYYAAFAKLFKAGMTVEEIGSRFDKTQREVQQLLAVGSLPKKILALAEMDVIGDRTLKALAIAPAKDVARYSKLTNKTRPNDWDIQTWLAGSDGMYMQKYAIFDLEKYTGPKMTDLFANEDEVWLLDGAQFWDLQTAAYDAKLTAYNDKGWQVEKIDYWQQWAYDKVAKTKGGKVFWTKDDKTGAVEFHVGYKRKETAGKTPKAKDDTPKLDTSKAFDCFTAQIRHDAVARHMLDSMTTDKRAGLVGTLIVLLKQCDNMQFRRGSQLVKGEAYCNSLNNSDNHQVLKSDFADMMEDIGLKHSFDMKIDKIGPKLMEYTVPTLMRWIVTVVATSWEIDFSPDNSDAIGKAIGLTQVNTWEADDAFWNGITNKNTLLKIAKDHKISFTNKATSKKIRAVLKQKVPPQWRPDWLKF